MLKSKSKLHERMFKIATILFDLIFVFAFFFVLTYILETVLLKQSHFQLYVQATYYTSIIQKCTLRLAVLSFQTFVTFLGLWFITAIITYLFKLSKEIKQLESETK